MKVCYIKHKSILNINMFQKVIIWGYPLNTHTHSFVHYGWHKGFKALGYETYWFHDQDYLSATRKKNLSAPSRRLMQARSDRKMVRARYFGWEIFANMTPSTMASIRNANLYYSERKEKGRRGRRELAHNARSPTKGHR